MSQVRLDEPRAAQILGGLADQLKRFPKELDNAMYAAVMSMTKKTKNKAIQLILKRYKVDRESVEKKIRWKFERQGEYGYWGKIYGLARGSTLHSYDHEAMAVTTSRGPRKGVKVHVLRKGGMKTLKGGFIATSGKNKTEQIFKRRHKGSKAKDIKVLYGASLSGWFGAEENLEALETWASAQMVKTLTAVANAKLKKLGVL